MLICSIYRSSRKDEMYLYVDKRDGLKKVPEVLLDKFGKAQHVMDMPMTEKRELARVNVKDVLSSIQEKGFFLQMPPPKEDYLLDLFPGRPETGVR
ncbi:YcgL domain-containing protein [Nitrincola tibetensis]|uniref:YcgL domain-containing protein DN062_01625 n=1 Tax=Nitrincola tibetensis TaxID=2219697 RepID=A0A364NRU1_9GAMM|nr:YcgL domain-containing protein [Nitrincola tibetensis]RAU19806.1 YcgL domain-containing protein [Nitrincola tibetensis]